MSKKGPSKREISEVMRVLGQRGGKKGGWKKMSAEQRKQRAQKAAQARWSKKRSNE